MLAQVVVEKLASDTSLPALLIFRSQTTGIPFCQGLNKSSFIDVKEVVYRSDDYPDSDKSLPELEECIRKNLRGRQKYSLAFVDPFHTHAATTRTVQHSLRVLPQESIIIVHDVYPPEEMIAPHFKDGSWCGSTWHAFIDGVFAGNREWITINSDFGIGILGPAYSKGALFGRNKNIRLEWRKPMEYSDRWQFVKAHSKELLHLVEPSEAMPYLASLSRIAKQRTLTRIFDFACRALSRP